jgi:hypothetical protein
MPNIGPSIVPISPIKTVRARAMRPMLNGKPWADHGAQFELTDASGIRSCSHKQRVSQRSLECDGIRVVSVKPA